MDFTKYVSILETQALFFSRADKLEDPYEGATSHINATIRPLVYKNIPIEKIAALSRLSNSFRQWTYINCWHMNYYESSAMWKLYGAFAGSVAIRSTYGILSKCLADEAYVGIVNYIDYDKDWLPEGNAFWPYVHKRKSFEYERELRAIIQEWPTTNGKYDDKKKNEKNGKMVKIDINKLIGKVYISPTATEWFAELVSTITKKYGFNFKVEQSILAKDPVY